MEENEEGVIEEQTAEKRVSEPAAPQNIQNALLEEIKELKSLIKQLTSTLQEDDSI